MDQRLTMLMLGVDDIAQIRRFYEDGLGWKPWGARQSNTSVKYMVGGVVIAMIDREYVAREAGLTSGSGAVGIVPVVNLVLRGEVDRVAEMVVSAGGTVTSAPRDRDGGLYSFYFADPAGNPWEVVWNPNMPMDEAGVLQPSR
jgi:predicted lactoylglutathione lyase